MRSETILTMGFDAIGNDLDKLAHAEDQRKNGGRIAHPLQNRGKFYGFHGVPQCPNTISQNLGVPGLLDTCSNV